MLGTINLKKTIQKTIVKILHFSMNISKGVSVYTQIYLRECEVKIEFFSSTLEILQFN